MRRCTRIQVSRPPVLKDAETWLNIPPTEFVSPAAVRSAMKREKGDKYGKRKLAEDERFGRREGRRLEEDELAVSKVFA